MKILICPDKFKDSLPSVKVCEALSSGILKSFPSSSIKIHPMADGGDGSIEIIKSTLDLKEIFVETLDPLGRALKTSYFASKDIAFIELASASGLVLLAENERNPMYTSTIGTGLMIRDALEKGLNKVYLFIGGSATNDGGIGIANALGFDFISNNGDLLDCIGINLSKIKSITDKQDFNFDEIEIKVFCDVNNPMYGSNGAAYVYGRQKGANDKEIESLDKGLKNYASILKSQFSKDLASFEGMGAAGAVGASLHALMNSKLQNGFQLLADLTHLEVHIQNADLVITGEGKVDLSSFQGKVVGNVLAMCKKYGKPCGIVGGIVDDLKKYSNTFLFDKSIITYAKDLNDAMASPEKYLFEIGKEIGTMINSY